MKKLMIALLGFSLLTSCVSKKKYLESRANYDRSEITLVKTKSDLSDCDKQNSKLQSQLALKDNDIQNEKNKNKMLESQMDYFKSTNTNLLDRLSDMSVISKTGADNIRKSLESLQEQNVYIKDLTSSMRRKDSLNLILVMNLKRSLSDVNDEDVTVEVKKGVVYISLSDKMLFKSGSSDINSKAESVLEKIAKVLNDHTELDILVEGHTDNVPIANTCISDNWDLSVKRATSVVRLLQKQYNVKPERMTAGGRSEYVPKTSNETAEGKKINRRTEIIVLPKLDQFFNLLEAKGKN